MPLFNQNIARLTSPNGRFYEVHLAHAWCSCGRYQENGVPCDHALTFIYYLQREPANYMSQNLIIDTFLETYANNILPIAITPRLTPFDANLEDLEHNYTLSGQRVNHGLLTATLYLLAEDLWESESLGIAETAEFQEQN